jgi:hypothetical protein
LQTVCPRSGLGARGVSIFELGLPQSFELNQIEDTQEHALVISPISDHFEAGDAIRHAGDCLSIDDACARP